jgi:DNA repair photolyase
MVEHVTLTKLRPTQTDLYDVCDSPRLVDQGYLDELGVGVKPSKELVQEMRRGSEVFAHRCKHQSLAPKPSCVLQDISLEEPLKTHRYTCKCPVDVLEVNPLVGCNVNCLYCLVTNGDHSAPKDVYQNYGKYLRRQLAENGGADHCYFFAAKTEPFQEATLQTGIAHDVLREFIAYFQSNPASRSTIYVLSKAGKEELQYSHGGDTILDLMKALSDRLTYAVSLSLMPPELYPMLEPRAASNEARLEASVMCQKAGVWGHEAVVQPILPTYLTDATMDELVAKLKKANIAKFKPELLTVSPQNLAWIGEMVRHIDKDMAKQLYEVYLGPDNINNVKHNDRMAPDREFARKAMLELKKHADDYGIKMTLCHWVRSELDISVRELPPHVRENTLKKSWVCKPV